VPGPAHRLHAELDKTGQPRDRAQFTLVTPGKLMPTHASSTRVTFLGIFASQGIEVIEGDGVAHVSKDTVELCSGRSVPADECIWCTDAAPQS